MAGTFAPGRQSTAHANEEIDQEDDHNNKQDHQLDVLPPHPSPQAATAHAEISRTATQPVGLVYEQVDSLTAL